jgi:hypothetical protein
MIKNRIPLKAKEDIKEIRDYLTKVVRLPYERYKTFDTLNDEQIILLFEFSDYFYEMGKRDAVDNMINWRNKIHPENNDVFSFLNEQDFMDYNEDEWDEEDQPWDDDDDGWDDYEDR